MLSRPPTLNGMRGRFSRTIAPMLATVPRTHLVLGAIVCVLLPAATWIDRSLGPAWSMFTSAASHRIRIVATDEGGARRTISPTALASRLTPSMAAVIAGSEQWRHGDLPRLRENLEPFARLACELGAPRSIDVLLEERERFDAPVVDHSAHVACRP